MRLKKIFLAVFIIGYVSCSGEYYPSTSPKPNTGGPEEPGNSEMPQIFLADIDVPKAPQPRSIEELYAGICDLEIMGASFLEDLNMDPLENVLETSLNYETNFLNERGKNLNAVYAINHGILSNPARWVYTISRLFKDAKGIGIFKDLLLFKRHTASEMPKDSTSESIERPFVITSKTQNKAEEITLETFGKELLHDIFVFSTILNPVVTESKRFSQKLGFYYNLAISAFTSATAKILMLSGDLNSNSFKGIIRPQEGGASLTANIVETFNESPVDISIPHSFGLIDNNLSNILVSNLSSNLRDKVAILKGLIGFYVATAPEKYANKFFGPGKYQLPPIFRKLVMGLFNIFIKSLYKEHLYEFKDKEIAVNGQKIRLENYISLTSNQITNSSNIDYIDLSDLTEFLTIKNEIKGLMSVKDDLINESLMNEEDFSELSSLVEDIEFSQGFFILSKYQNLENGLYAKTYYPIKNLRSTGSSSIPDQIRAAAELYSLEKSIGGTIFSSSADMALKTVFKKISFLSDLDFAGNMKMITSLNEINAAVNNPELKKLMQKMLNNI